MIVRSDADRFDLVGRHRYGRAVHGAGRHIDRIGSDGTAVPFLWHDRSAGRYGGVTIRIVIAGGNAPWRRITSSGIVHHGLRDLSMAICRVEERFVAGVVVEVAVLVMLGSTGRKTLPHTGEQARFGAVAIILIGAVMRRNPFGEGERRVSHTHFVGELLRLVGGVITSLRRAYEP